MLQFDPTMRASCEEILAHRYFESSTLASTDSLNEEAAQEVEAMSIDASDERRAEFWEIDHPGLALEELEKAFVRVREKGEKATRHEKLEPAQTAFARRGDLRGAAEALSCPDRPTNARRAHRNSLNGALGGI